MLYCSVYVSKNNSLKEKETMRDLYTIFTEDYFISPEDTEPDYLDNGELAVMNHRSLQKASKQRIREPEDYLNLSALGIDI
jgi:hypothetical protein